MRVEVVVTDTTSDGGGNDDGSDDNDNGSVACFSGNSMVSTANGDVPMKDIQVGDMVRTANNRYQPVYTFGHYNEVTPTEFVKLSYQAAGKANSIEVSREHLLYIQGKARPVRADSIAKGDMLLHADAVDAKVTKVAKITRQGYYAPLTEDGTIVVDGLVASVYATLMTKTSSEQIELNGWTFPFADQETCLHLGAAPLRMLCKLNLDFCHIEGNKADAKGFNPYVSWGVDMIQWGENQHAAIQVVGSLLVFVGFVALNILEAFVLRGAGFFLKGIMTLITIAIMVKSGSEKTGAKALKTAA